MRQAIVDIFENIGLNNDDENEEDDDEEWQDKDGWIDLNKYELYKERTF